MFEFLVNPFASPELVLPFIAVALGTMVQVTTGLGLGLIAGPLLLLVLDGASAIQTAICLNLLVTALTLPSEVRQVDRGALISLSTWAFPGIPLGTLLLILLPIPALKLFSGFAVLLATLQIGGKSRDAAVKTGKARPLGGFLSGVMTGILSAPGPFALWGLLSTRLDLATIRANLRAYFLVVYVLALTIHFLMSGVAEALGSALSAFALAVVLGAGGGFLLRSRISETSQFTILKGLLLMTGLSLLWQGAAHVF